MQRRSRFVRAEFRAAVAAVIAGAIGCRGGDAQAPADAAVEATTSEVGVDAPGEDAIADAPRTDAPAPSDEPPLTKKTFAESTGDILNPERGWMNGDGLALVDAADYSDLRTAHYALAYAKVRLDAFRTTPIDAPTLAALGDGLTRVRLAGIKVILRFVYNDAAGVADASEAQIMAHLAQLAPILAANADVIDALEAGFIGAWGEWHDSTNGLDDDGARKRVIDAILASLPKSRAVLVRVPSFKAAWYPAPLASADAYSGSAQARIGHHNDCFLASADDQGTYVADATHTVDDWKTFIASETLFLPIGGETCAVSSRSICATATSELARLHFSFLNNGYHPDVIQGWKDGGCYDEIARRLGYRFVRTQAAWSEQVRPGGLLRVSFTVNNRGYAALYNARPVQVILTGATTKRTATLSIDPRSWQPGSTVDVARTLRIPADLPRATYRLSLALPDADPKLAGSSAYAVQFADDGAWDDARGENVLTDALVISASAPGSVDGTATIFAEVP